jgi:hypothetical protein
MSEPPDERRPRPAAVQLHEPDDAHLPAVAPDDAEEEDASKLVASYVTYDSVSALFGSLERSGEWQVPDRLRVRARFGEVKLDFCPRTASSRSTATPSVGRSISLCPRAPRSRWRACARSWAS